MYLTPLTYTVAGEAISFGEPTDPVPLPPWSGIPVAMQMEVGPDLLARLLQIEGAGLLHGLDEAGAAVYCPAVVDPLGCHTCETDTVLMLVQCGPFEPEKGGANGDED